MKQPSDMHCGPQLNAPRTYGARFRADLNHVAAPDAPLKRGAPRLIC